MTAFTILGMFAVEAFVLFVYGRRLWDLYRHGLGPVDKELVERALPVDAFLVVAGTMIVAWGLSDMRAWQWSDWVFFPAMGLIVVSAAVCSVLTQRSLSENER